MPRLNGCASVLAALMIWVSVQAQPTAAPATAPRVHTASGWVTGRQGQSHQSFLGIPYSAPPVGALRWKPPQALAPWRADHDATQFTPECPHVPEPGDDTPMPPMSEDCLVLNVWTPAADGKRRPVMVFIHGGAFMEGGINKEYDGTAFTKRGDVVFVNFQYRIGAFGFLQLDEAGGEGYAASGNLGILDQIAALRWVHANIEAFGGDPNNVMLFGESAGAVSVATLLSLEETEGLYAKALLESPRAPFVVTKPRAHRLAAQLIKLSGAKNFAQFKALDWQGIMKAEEALFRARFEDTCFSPVLDEQVIKEASQAKLIAGRGVQVPTLFGTNLEELKFWEKGEGLPMSTFSPELLTQHLKPLLGERARQVVDLYRRENVDRMPAEGNIMLLSDLTFRLPSIRLAEARSKKSPTWLYLFSYRGGEFGAGHADELPWIFEEKTPKGSIGTDAERRVLHELMQDTWITFARSGDPNHARLPAWPTYEGSRRATLQFDLQTAVVNDPYGALREAWDGVPFDGLTPDIDAASGMMTIGGGGQYWHWPPEH
jgi:para-nitrobenzyl esterase